MAGEGVGSDVPPAERGGEDEEHADEGEVKQLDEWDEFYRDEYGVRLINPQGFLPVEWEEEMTEAEFIEGLAESEVNPPEDTQRIKVWLADQYDGPVDLDDTDVDFGTLR